MEKQSAAWSTIYTKPGKFFSVYFNIILAAKTCLNTKLIQSAHQALGEVTHQFARITICIFTSPWDGERYTKLVIPHDDRTATRGAAVDRDSILAAIPNAD